MNQQANTYDEQIAGYREIVQSWNLSKEELRVRINMAVMEEIVRHPEKFVLVDGERFSPAEYEQVWIAALADRMAGIAEQLGSDELACELRGEARARRLRAAGVLQG